MSQIRWLGAAWTLPNTCIGLLLGAAGLLRGASVRFSRREHALVFAQWPWGPGGAITFGNVILTTTDSLDVMCKTYDDSRDMRLGDHERAHVLQYMVLGIFFLPLYALGGIASASNRFERAADRYATTGRGWWPWA